MAISKRKKTTAIVAGATAAALLLGGTFAWTSISQQAQNEAAGIVNVGGRLHDDFDGTNKDVYVENFTDPYNGGQPIYARVKLTEYMEIGQDAGGFGADVNGDGRVIAVPVISGTDINDKDNWPVHIPEGSCAACATEGTCKLHDHWSWSMGGEGGNNGSAIFMPTFNKDKDSLVADINGTYHGTDNTDKVYYDDYVVYTADNTVEGVGVGVAEADKEAYDGSIYSVIGTEYYDDDTDTDDNGGTRQVENVTHTAKATSTAKVITMAEWLDENGEYNGQPGNYWVYDTDGWAYWANPIMPGEATGLLLDGIVMEKNPGEKCYYAINVVGQFATVNDWEEFYTDADTKEYDVSPDAEAVLKAAAGNVATVTVTNVSGATLVERGESVTFFASTVVGATATLAASDEYVWVVLDEELKEVETSTITDNGDGTVTLTIGDEEFSEALYVAARSRQHGGAVGLSAIAIPIKYTIDVSAASNTVDAGKTLALSAVVTKNGAAETSGVIWSLDGGSGTTAIDENGLLTVDANEKHGTALTVTATSVANSEVVDTYPITVYNGYNYLNTIAIGTAEKVRIDNTEWYVLARDEAENKALIWSADVIARFDEFGSYGNNKWNASISRTYLNNDYLNTLTVLKTHVLETKLYTANSYDRTGSYYDTTDRIFLLSEADLFGTANGSETANEQEYTLGTAGVIATTLEMRKSPTNKTSWLRSPSGSSSQVATLDGIEGTYMGLGVDTPRYMRPAMWVELTK